MTDLDHDSLRARLRAGDPYQGESMQGPDAARIRARMRAAAVDAQVRPNRILAAAAVAIVTVVALGVWVGSRPSTTEEPTPLPLPATSDGAAVAELPAEPVSAPQPPSVAAPTRPGLAVVHPAPALPSPREHGLVVIAPPDTADATQVAPTGNTVAATETPRTEARHVQFIAPRGTRIVWTLDPDFEPSTVRNDARQARHQQGANGKW